MKTLLNTTLAATAAALLAPFAAAQISFERIAPENSILVAGVQNVSAARARFERTSLHALWRSDEMQDLRSEMMAEIEGGLAEVMRELGVDREDFVLPTGSVGLALFAVIDPEIGMPAPAFITFADYGEGADNLQRLLDAVLERGREDGEFETEERDILDRTVLSITFARDEADWDVEGDEDDWGFDDEEDDWGVDDEDDAWGDEEDWEFEEDPLGMGSSFDVFRTVHLVREGSSFLLCSDLGSITEVLDRLDNDRVSGLSEREDYRTALDMIGANDAYAILMTRDLAQLVQAFDQTGMAMMFVPMIQGLVGNMSSISTGVMFDAPEAMVRSNFAVHMPQGKRGLTDLMDVSAPRGPLPAFVGEGAYSYTSVNFAFNRIVEAAQQYVQENPMLAMMGGAEMLDEVEPIIRPLFESLGSRVHMVGKLERPLTAQSNQSVVAVETTNPEQFEAILAGLAEEYGIEAQDFNGHRLYTGSMPGMMMPNMGVPMPEMALGIGGGYIFMGARPAVEQSLNATGGDQAKVLARNPQLARVLESIPDVPLVSWGYADVVTTIEATVESQRIAMEQMRDEFPWMDEMEGEDPFSEFVQKIDYDLIRRYIGPSVTWLRSTDTGFVGSALYFEPLQRSE